MTRALGRPRDETVDASVLQAAVEIVADRGYESLTMEAVAARAGVAKSSVYRRWPGKDELIWDALSRIKGPIEQEEGESVRADLGYLLEGIRRAWMDGLHGRLMRRLAADGSDQPQHYRDIRERLTAPRHAVLREVLQRGMAEGSIRPDVDCDWVIQLLVGPIVAAGLTHQDSVPSDQVQFMLDTVLAGISP